MDNNRYGDPAYVVPRSSVLGTSKDKPLLEDYNMSVVSLDQSLPSVKKSVSGKHKDKMTLNLRGYKRRLMSIAKKEGRRHYTMAADMVIDAILKIEKRHKKENI
jgi:hypothetical protein